MDERYVPAWVVQQAVAKAIGDGPVRGIEHRTDSTYAVLVDDEAVDDAPNEEPKPCGEYHLLPCGIDLACPETDTDEDDHRLAGAEPDEQPAPPPWEDDETVEGFTYAFEACDRCGMMRKTVDDSGICAPCRGAPVEETPGLVDSTWATPITVCSLCGGDGYDWTGGCPRCDGTGMAKEWADDE